MSKFRSPKLRGKKRKFEQFFYRRSSGITDDIVKLHMEAKSVPLSSPNVRRAPKPRRKLFGTTVTRRAYAIARKEQEKLVAEVTHFPKSFKEGIKQGEVYDPTKGGN